MCQVRTAVVPLFECLPAELAEERAQQLTVRLEQSQPLQSSERGQRLVAEQSGQEAVVFEVVDGEGLDVVAYAFIVS